MQFPMQDPLEVALQTLFTQSDDAFAAGDNKMGSSKLWEAAESALSIVAAKRGWPCETVDDHFSIMGRLGIQDRDDVSVDLVRSGYLAARQFRYNADHEFMVDYVIRGARPLVSQFVFALLGVEQGYGLTVKRTQTQSPISSERVNLSHERA